LTGVKTGVDCLFCQEIDALNSKFDNKNIHCITHSTGFTTLCINKLVLANVLTGLCETRLLLRKNLV